MADMADGSSSVTLSVPAEAGYARAVRMMAANLAVLGDMSVDDVEDVRMAAGEGFVYVCATAPETCDVTFSLAPGEVRMEFGLGGAEPPERDDLGLSRLMLSALCDEFAVVRGGSVLRLVKRAGGAYAG